MAVLCLVMFESVRGQEMIEIQSSEPEMPIEIDTITGGFRYTQDGQILRLREVKQIIKTDPPARYALKGYGGLNFFAFTTGFVGGYLVGYEFGSMIGGGEVRMGRMFLGSGVIAASIGMGYMAQTRLRDAVIVYNRSLTEDE